MFNVNVHIQELRSMIVGVVLFLSAIIIGIVWISVGVCSYLSNHVGATWGPIILGLLFLAPVLIVAFIRASGRNTRAARQQEAANGFNDMGTANIAKIIESLSGQPPFIVTSAAIIAGVLAARFPALLSIFAQILVAYVEDVKSRAAKKAAEKNEHSVGN